MSDYPNGRPPGQNNLDATSPAYVPAENDPSATAQKSDAVRPKEDGIEVHEDDASPEVKKELAEAGKNIVQPSSAEEQPEDDGAKPGTVPSNKEEPTSTPTPRTATSTSNKK